MSTADEGLRRLAEAELVSATGATRIVRLCARCGSDRHGQPFAIGSTAAVSMSYAGSMAAVAWTWSGPVGIDIETDAEPLDGVGDRRTWTRVEALLKSTGEGLRRDVTDLPELESRPIRVPYPLVGSVAGAGVNWRLVGPAAPCGPTSR